jgi:hypothetical protein
VDVNNYKIQTWLEDRYAELAGKAEYQKLRASFKDKDAGVATQLLESEFVERLGRQFKTRDPGPTSAFHAELLERLTQQTKIDDDALVKLAQARGQAMRDNLVKLDVEDSRVSVAAPGTQSAKDKLVPSKMSLGASRKAAVESLPATEPVPSPVPATP